MFYQLSPVHIELDSDGRPTAEYLRELETIAEGLERDECPDLPIYGFEVDRPSLATAANRFGWRPDKLDGCNLLRFLASLELRDLLKRLTRLFRAGPIFEFLSSLLRRFRKRLDKHLDSASATVQAPKMLSPWLHIRAPGGCDGLFAPLC